MPNLAQNKRARFDYDILETLEAGLTLSGAETKAVKNGQINLKGSFVTFHGPRALLTNAHISAYPFAVQKDYDPTHSRPLLLHKKEIRYLQAKSQEAGLTIVPLSVYTKNRYIKVEIGVAKGRKQYDKREVIKKKDVEREIRRAVAN